MKRNFVILSSARSGTSFLRSTFNSHRAITCHGEIFHKNFENHIADKNWFEKWWQGNKSEIIPAEYFSPPVEAPKPTEAVVEPPEIVEVAKPKQKVKPPQKEVLKPTPPRVMESYQQFIPKNVAFNRAASEILPVSFPELDKLANFLSKNSNRKIKIEGHTDNVPYSGSGNLKGNWDLSAKRATAIVNILRENKSIDPKNLTAAGRGEYAPVAPNDTAENKAKNRRIEVILTPKLDELTKLLNDI